MKKKMDKLKWLYNSNKKVLIFLFGLLVVGFIFGTVFITMINNSDKTLVKDYITKYIESVKNVNYFKCMINSLINNLGFILIIWLLGISVIGIPVILFICFGKAFTLGFSISSFILNYKAKGCLYALIYLFPSQIVSLIMYTILTLYSLTFSLRIISSVVNKKTLDFKYLSTKYIKVLVICIIVSILCSLYDVFVIPNILKHFI